MYTLLNQDQGGAEVKINEYYTYLIPLQTRKNKTHYNYFKPDDVIFLCKAHHVEMHKWDSF